MPKVETEITIKGNPQDVWEIISDMEKYPEFMDDLIDVKVLERGENTTKTHWVAKAKNMTVEWDEEDFYYPDEYRIYYKAKQGVFSKFEGEWTIEKLDEETIKVRLTVDFEIGVPMFRTLLGPLATKLIKDNCVSMLNAIKERAEGT
ncbi:cyclase [bacterium 3DAC]|jgi:ribosome-associated toxin RatA of RatAB toxin-antitoxin module|nr:cyclase [Dictyoglomota bacterium]UZN23078.1 cyclase [bacterium 3DAC]